MAWYEFAGRLIIAFIFGGLVGAERQWRQRTAGLRTNCLVAVGSAMFVMMGGLVGDGDGSQGRVAAYVVSGIGFIGGGVILKEGFTIRGLNTAATLWCTAAIGTLAGLGHTSLSFLGTVVVLAANLVLRPLGQRINRASAQSPEEVFPVRDRIRLPRLRRGADSRTPAPKHRANASFPLRAPQRGRGRNKPGQSEGTGEIHGKEGQPSKANRHAAIARTGSHEPYAGKSFRQQMAGQPS